ncbi:MAG: transcriptional regulator [Breznakibacter sp.]
MIGVITGDIIGSQHTKPDEWLGALKGQLNKIGETPRQWEIFRGDSFQVEIAEAHEALLWAIRIKAAVKTIKGADVRMSVGLGHKSYAANAISECNGPAFVLSGERFELLKKEKQNIMVASGSQGFDLEMNLLLRLALIVMDNWSSSSAEMVLLALEHPHHSQAALGSMLNIKQNAVSSRLKRACFNEICQMIDMYQTKLSQLLP